MGNGADDFRNHHAYESVACEHCGNYTLVRHGEFLKCDSCDFDQTPVACIAIEPPKAVGVEPKTYVEWPRADTFAAH